MSDGKDQEQFVFNRIKDKLSQVDPVAFCEKYLTLDGKPYRLSKSGYRPQTEILRYIGIKALEKNSLPVIILKSRQTGISTAANALEMYFMGSGLFGVDGRPPIRVIHAFPQLDLADAYSKVKLNGMIASSIPAEGENPNKGKTIKSHMQSLLDTSAPTNDSLKFKQFKGGNHIWIESMGLAGERLRGRTADVMFLDEIQEMPAAAIGNATKVLNRAQYGATGSGVQVYFGTPKSRNSTFADMWKLSSQQFFHLGCRKCKEYFPLYTPGSNEWEDIWIYGFTVRCTHCGCEQDKFEAAERGRWIAANNDPNVQFVGFFINQLYMPGISKEKLLSEKPGVSTINTERSYQNEVLGEFFQGEASSMTPEQVREICGDTERRFRANAASSSDNPIFLGVDIGSRNDMAQLADNDKSRGQGQSFSTAVVLEATGPSRLEIIYACKFKRNDLASKKGIIDELMRRYSCNLGICDIGHAQDLNEILSSEYGDKFLSSRVAGKLNNHIKFHDDITPKEIRFEKDFYIGQLYDQMKKGSIRFPLGDYEQISWLIAHCTSMEIKPSMSRGGDFEAHYIKGTIPNDGFMALLNAYLAYKFYISNGFKIQVSGNNAVKAQKPLMITGYVPKMR
jgi:hypothetical protein